MVSVLCSVEVVYSPVLTAKADKQKLSNFCRSVHDFVSLSLFLFDNGSAGWPLPLLFSCRLMLFILHCISSPAGPLLF